LADIDLNWLDRTIGWLSPQRQVERLKARVALNEFNMTYRGGVATRLDRGWAATPSGITVQTMAEHTGLVSMRERARKVDRDNPVGHGMLNRLVDNVIGEGMTLQARTESADFNKEAEEKWRAFWEAPEVTGLFTGPELERITYREHERDGDVGWILVSRNNQSRLQLVRADQISTPDTKQSQSPKTSGQIHNGVEVNSVGRPTAFHILNGDEYGKRKWERIDARDFVYLPRLKRGNQVRGEPCFAQVFPQLDQLDGFVDAVTTAARMAAVFGLVFKQSNSGTVLSGLPTVTNSQGNQQRAVTLENGSIKYIGQDDEVAQVQASQPMQQTPDFVRLLLRLIGLPMDMPLELVLYDFSQVNFSSARASLLQFYRAMRPRQRSFATRAMSRTYRWWISREVKNGTFTTRVPNDFFPHEFMPRGWQWVDPVKEAQAILLQIDAGLTTRQRELKSMGIDPEELLAEQVADMQARELAKLPPIFSTLTRDPTPEPVEKPANANPDTDRSK
jgi:lambda family phage portal protein